MHHLLPLLRSKTLLLLLTTILVSLALIVPPRSAHASIVVYCPAEDYRDHCADYYSDAAKTQFVCTDCCDNVDTCVATPYYRAVTRCCV